MNSLVAEFLGTTILVLLGNAVVANVLLKRTKGHDDSPSNAGWLVITTGWGLAVTIAVTCSEAHSGAHLNPAVTVGLAAAGTFAWADVAGYVAAQMLGGAVGAVIVYVLYRQHYDATEDPDTKLGTFCNAPAIRSVPNNLLSELVATFVLVYTVLSFVKPGVTSLTGEATGEVGLGAVGAIPVGLLVFAIGISLGGTTGYAINPARDFSPRLMHALLPIRGKRDPDWGYSWIPVVGPLLGGLLAAGVYHLVMTVSPEAL